MTEHESSHSWPDNLAQSKAKAQAEPFTIPTVERQYDSFFREVSRLDPGDVVMNHKCKFCKHPLRAQAEEKWERMGRSFAPVTRYFSEAHTKDPDNCPIMNLQNVRRHLLNHYDQQEKRKYIEDYTDRIGAIMNYKRSMDQKFEFLAHAAEVQILETLADPSISILKKNDSFAKLSKSLVDICKVQNELRGDVNPINEIMQKFKAVWVKVIDAQQDESIRRLLMDSLSEFQGELEGLPLLDKS